jgi:Domain of unknown function (DUF4055)
VLREFGTEDRGKFGEDVVERYRVFKRGEEGVTWELHRIKDKEMVQETEGTFENITEIPFVPVYATKPDAHLESTPPLKDLADVNVEHYQTKSDHNWALHMTSVPQVIVTGVDPAETAFEISPNGVWKLPEGADAKFLEHSGKSLGQTRQALEDLKADMAVLGLSMLMHETRQAETAEAKRIDKAEQDSSLSTAARSLQDALELALGFHAQYMKLETGGQIEVNREFEKNSVDAAQVTIYSGMVASGQLSLETMWQVLAEGGVLPDDFDPEVENNRIADSMLMSGEDSVDEEDEEANLDDDNRASERE